MAKFTIERATIEHIEHVACYVREADVEELSAAAGITPLEAMLIGRKWSVECWCGMADGEPICIFGVSSASPLSRSGHPWMVGTEHLDRLAFGFLRRSRNVVHDMLSRYDELYNYVDARNTRAIRWLRWLGFTIMDTEPYGLCGLPFHRFEMRR